MAKTLHAANTKKTAGIDGGSAQFVHALSLKKKTKVFIDFPWF